MAHFYAKLRTGSWVNIQPFAELLAGGLGDLGLTPRWRSADAGRRYVAVMVSGDARGMICVLAELTALLVFGAIATAMSKARPVGESGTR